MGNIVSSVLSQLDPNIAYIFAAIMIISGILALIKKAIKITIIAIVLAVGVASLGPMATKFQKDYRFEVKNKTATVYIKDKAFEINKDKISNIEMQAEGNEYYILKVKSKDELGSIKLPKFIGKFVRSYAEKNNIPCTVKD